MLRITVHDNSGALTFQLEGSVAGLWVRELESCWQNALAGRRKPILRVDLTGATFIDAGGKAGVDGELRGIFAGDEKAALFDKLFQMSQAVVTQAWADVRRAVESAEVWS